MAKASPRRNKTTSVAFAAFDGPSVTGPCRVAGTATNRLMREDDRTDSSPVKASERAAGVEAAGEGCRAGEEDDAGGDPETCEDHMICRYDGRQGRVVDEPELDGEPAAADEDGHRCQRFPRPFGRERPTRRCYRESVIHQVESPRGGDREAVSHPADEVHDVFTQG